MKRILGVLFIGMAVPLSLVSLTFVPRTLEVIGRAFSGQAYDVGYIIGHALGLSILFGAIYFLFRYGLKWVRGKSRTVVDATVLDEDLRKRILGVLFIGVAVLLGLVFLTLLPRTLEIIDRAFSGQAYDVGFMIGYVLGLSILFGAIYFLFRYGLKWVSGKPRTVVDPTVLDENLRS